MTVFKHFDRKEDLLLDLFPDGVELVRSAIRGRDVDVDPVAALAASAFALTEERTPLSVLNEGIEPFMRIVMDAPSLIARLREFGREIEQVIADELAADERFDGDAALVAALVVAAYRTVAVGTVMRRLAGETLDAVVVDHQDHLRAAFGTLQRGLDRSR